MILSYSKENTTIKISLSGGGEIIGNTTVELVKGAFTDYTFPIKGLTADSKIKFSAIDASNNRFFLDEVKVEKLHVELNETSATAPEEKAITDVTLNRTFNADRWNPVCLPFAITAEQITEWFGEDSEVAEYIGDEESNGNVTVKFRKKTDGMNANTPYLLFPKKNVTVSKFPAVEIITTDMPKSEGTIFDFVGTYTNQPKGSSEIQMGDYIVSGGIFKKASGGNAIKAFRAYLRQRDVSNAKTVSMLFEDETTGISTLFTTSAVEIAVGIPQSQNVSPRYLSSALYVSTAAQLVPPAPSISIKSTPASTSILADSAEIPQPVSFARTGILTESVICAIKSV